MLREDQQDIAFSGAHTAISDRLLKIATPDDLASYLRRKMMVKLDEIMDEAEALDADLFSDRSVRAIEAWLKNQDVPPNLLLAASEQEERLSSDVGSREPASKPSAGQEAEADEAAAAEDDRGQADESEATAILAALKAAHTDGG